MEKLDFINKLGFFKGLATFIYVVCSSTLPAFMFWDPLDLMGVRPASKTLCSPQNTTVDAFLCICLKSSCSIEENEACIKMLEKGKEILRHTGHVHESYLNLHPLGKSSFLFCCLHL